MSFNLVQEEVISNVKSIAKTLGIIKSDSDDSEDEDWEVIASVVLEYLH